MNPDFSFVEAAGYDDVQQHTATFFVLRNLWFAWRKPRYSPEEFARADKVRAEVGLAPLDIRNGVFWSPNGTTIVSLATGASLHIGPQVDYELLVTRGDPDFTDGNICCHENFQAALLCAAHFDQTGYYCDGVTIEDDEAFED